MMYNARHHEEASCLSPTIESQGADIARRCEECGLDANRDGGIPSLSAWMCRPLRVCNDLCGGAGTCPLVSAPLVHVARQLPVRLKRHPCVRAGPASAGVWLHRRPDELFAGLVRVVGRGEAQDPCASGRDFPGARAGRDPRRLVAWVRRVAAARPRHGRRASAEGAPVCCPRRKGRLFRI